MHTEKKSETTPGSLASRLPIHIDYLLHAWVAEIERIEFQAGPDPILRTRCAFTNDLDNLGGGYLLIGQDCNDGQPVFPPVGVFQGQLEKIQKELLQDGHLIHPPCFPTPSNEEFQRTMLTVLWAPGFVTGEARAYFSRRDHPNFIERPHESP